MSAEMNLVYCVTPGKYWDDPCWLCNPRWVLSSCRHEQYFDKSATCFKFQVHKSSQKKLQDWWRITYYIIQKKQRNLKTPSNKSRIRMILNVPLKVTQLLVGTVKGKYFRKMMLCSVRPFNCGYISNTRISVPRLTSFWVASMAKVCTGHAWCVTVHPQHDEVYIYPWWEGLKKLYRNLRRRFDETEFQAKVKCLEETLEKKANKKGIKWSYEGTSDERSEYSTSK